MQHFKTLESSDSQRIFHWLQQSPTLTVDMRSQLPLEAERLEQYVVDQLTAIAAGQLLSFLGLVGSQIIGKIDVRRLTQPHEAHVGLVEFGLLPNFDAAGQQLILDAMDAARDLAIEALLYSAPGLAAPHIPLFERVGFQRVGAIPDYYKLQDRYHDRVLYSRSL